MGLVEVADDVMGLRLTSSHRLLKNKSPFSSTRAAENVKAACSKKQKKSVT